MNDATIEEFIRKQPYGFFLDPWLYASFFALFLNPIVISVALIGAIAEGILFLPYFYAVGTVTLLITHILYLLILAPLSIAGIYYIKTGHIKSRAHYMLAGAGITLGAVFIHAMWVATGLHPFLAQSKWDENGYLAIPIVLTGVYGAYLFHRFLLARVRKHLRGD